MSVTNYKSHIRSYNMVCYLSLLFMQAIFYNKYSVLSDVWSFGCVMYEIWSLGHKPFEELSVKKV